MTFLDEYIRYASDVYSQMTWNGNPLVWRADLGVGYLPSNGYAYGEGYWETYQQYAAGSIGEALTLYRTEFVAKYVDPATICDVGIGSGQFIKHVGAKGCDINPYARDWLLKNKLFGDPYTEKFSALTFWDVLEHFDNPAGILSHTDKVFMSLPIHADFKACLASKHLKPNEHIWHFTDSGIKFFMKYHGFDVIEQGDGETQAGRESIMSYYFRRAI